MIEIDAHKVIKDVSARLEALVADASVKACHDNQGVDALVRELFRALESSAESVVASEVMDDVPPVVAVAEHLSVMNAYYAALAGIHLSSIYLRADLDS